MIKQVLISLLFLFTVSVAYSQVPDNQGRDSQPVNNQNLGPTEKEPLKLFIPNAFTPNDDGVNDQFYIISGNFAEFNFSVFDRWGNQVFTSNNPNFRWDGRVNGKPLPSDIYVFVFAGKTVDNLDIKRSGTISIVR